MTHQPACELCCHHCAAVMTLVFVRLGEQMNTEQCCHWQVLPHWLQSAVESTSISTQSVLLSLQSDSSLTTLEDHVRALYLYTAHLNKKSQGAESQQNKNVFKSRLNSLSRCQSSPGKLFHSRGSATAKLLSPSHVCVRGTEQVWTSADRRCRHPRSVASWQSSDRYSGVRPWRDLYTSTAILRSTQL